LVKSLIHLVLKDFKHKQLSLNVIKTTYIMRYRQVLVAYFIVKMNTNQAQKFLKKQVYIRVDKIIFPFKFDFIHNVHNNNAAIQLLGTILKNENINEKY
jgi:hypothetical protein